MTRMWIRQLAVTMGLGLMVMAAAPIGASSTWGEPTTDPAVLDSWETPGAGSLVEVRAEQTQVSSGLEVGLGALRLIDTLDHRVLELGYYEYGAGLFTPTYLKSGRMSFPSAASPGPRSPFWPYAISEISATCGSAMTASKGSSGPRARGPYQATSREGFAGVGVVAIAEAHQPPGHNAKGGGILYVKGSALKYCGPSGTVTILAQP
jgi:hypothetical protein